MQWLMRLRVLWGTHKSCHAFHLAPRTLRFQSLKQSNAHSIVTTDALAPEVDSVASECPALKTKLLVSDHGREGWLDFRSLIQSASPDHTCIKSKTTDPMVIFFTSGTTGFPKMAKHSHGLSLRHSFPSSRKLLQLKASDVFWCLSDPGWILAVMGAVFEPWTAGSTVFIHHLPQFDPKVIVETLFKYPITQCIAAPSVYRMILQENFGSLRFPTLEHCTTGGEAMLPEEQEKWRQRTGLLVHQVYGQSETGLTCGTLRGSQVKPGSMGKAIPPFDVQVIDDEGNVLPPNTEGNLGIRIKPTKPIGLFMLYEVVKAFIVLTPQFLSHDPDQLAKELQEHVKAVTAPYKYPRKVEFVPELPKTITGKIKRSELREKESSQMQRQ
uniref:medium-chain acyl-CoA ligase n=1 Tax=Myotis myotis TaxID=51298 RepID=A0A7J7XWY2_MYOMY|nr:acyl-CoA synthetase medium chain family member 1 [Myotis myotis]